MISFSREVVIWGFSTSLAVKVGFKGFFQTKFFNIIAVTNIELIQITHEEPVFAGMAFTSVGNVGIVTLRVTIIKPILCLALRTTYFSPKLLEFLYMFFTH